LPVRHVFRNYFSNKDEERSFVELYRDSFHDDEYFWSQGVDVVATSDVVLEVARVHSYFVSLDEKVIAAVVYMKPKEQQELLDRVFSIDPYDIRETVGRHSTYVLDIMTDRDHRRHGLGQRLLETVMTNNEKPFVADLSSEASYWLFRKLGFTTRRLDDSYWLATRN
jgi:ribosomal protein S18 acetylase RimI-like enzyme